MKTLVAYHTKGGASETYARVVAETLKEKGFDVTQINLKNTTPDVSGSELIIAGTGVRMFRVYGKWKKILKHKEIGKKKLALFLSSGTAIEKPDEAIEKWLNPLINKYKLNPISIGSFPGIIPVKMQESDAHKGPVKPELARQWAQELALKLRS